MEAELQMGEFIKVVLSERCRRLGMDYLQCTMDFPNVDPELTKKSMRLFCAGSDATLHQERLRRGRSVPVE